MAPLCTLYRGIAARAKALEWLAVCQNTVMMGTPLLVAYCKNERRSDCVQPVSVIVPFG